MGRKQQIKASRKELRKVVGDNIIADFMNLVNNQNILHAENGRILKTFDGGFVARWRWLFFGVPPLTIKEQD